MKPCIQNSKKICMNCKHYEYGDRANRCNGDCGHCDDATCENNPLYRLKTRKENKDVFMIRLDWSTTDADGIDTELYEDYDEAYDRYKEIITEQLKNFWQGEVTFDTDGDPGEEYEFSEEDNNSNESDVYWHLSLKDDYYVHTFVDLIRTPLHTKREETL